MPTKTGGRGEGEVLLALSLTRSTVSPLARARPSKTCSIRGPTTASGSMACARIPSGQRP